MIILESDPSIVESLVGLLVDDGIEREVAVACLAEAIVDIAAGHCEVVDAAVDFLIDRNG